MFNFLKKFLFGEEPLDTNSVSYRKKTLKLNIEEYENAKMRDNVWVVDLELLCDLLTLVEEDLLQNDSAPMLKSIELNCGFKNFKHLIDWLTLIRFKIESRDLPLTNEVLNVVRDRKHINFWNFLNHKLKRSSSVAQCKADLLAELKQLKITLDAVPDYRVKDRIVYNLSGVYRDIFSVIEAIIIVGVTDNE